MGRTALKKYIHNSYMCQFPMSIKIETNIFLQTLIQTGNGI